MKDREKIFSEIQLMLNKNKLAVSKIDNERPWGGFFVIDENASKKLDAFYQYLLDEWSFRDAEKFLDQVQEFEFTISYFSKSFVQSKKRKRYRIGLVHRYVSAIYEVRKSDIVIIALIDNRSNKKVR